MAAILNANDIPIAYAMIAAARRGRPRRDGHHPYQQYFFLWTAFASIYEALAERQGLKPELKRREDGSVVTRRVGSVNIPEIAGVDKQDRIAAAVQEFEPALKHSLLAHESTHYFAYRIPYFQGVPLEKDALGQRLNGVINLRSTLDNQYPVWSPVDLEYFEEYLRDPAVLENADFLVTQIVGLLHTVRKNLLAHSDRFDDSNDLSVVKHALPLLELIVDSFTR